MSREAPPRVENDDLTLAPPARRRFGRKFRLLWGHGVFSGLPLAEVLLLTAFIASAGMFLTSKDDPNLIKAKQPVNTQSMFAIN